MRSKFIWTFFMVAILVMVMAGVVSCAPSSGGGTEADTPVLTITKGSESKSLTMEELKALPSVEAVGCLMDEDYLVTGPFRAKGVAVLELCEIVGGLGADEEVEFDFADGFTMLHYNHLIASNFKTYDAKTGERCPHGDVTVLLAYEVGGEPPEEYKGGYLRLMVLAGENIATTGILCIQGVTKVDIHKGAAGQNTPI